MNSSEWEEKLWGEDKDGEMKFPSKLEVWAYLKTCEREREEKEQKERKGDVMKYPWSKNLWGEEKENKTPSKDLAMSNFHGYLMKELEQSSKERERYMIRLHEMQEREEKRNRDISILSKKQVVTQDNKKILYIENLTINNVNNNYYGDERK